MKISTRGHYAVQAMVDLACQPNNSPTSLSVVAARQDLSQNYLEQLFVKLRKYDLVKSVRGPGGGYMLANDASKITIGDVFRAVDETLVITECAETQEGDVPACSKLNDCRTQMLWAKLVIHFNELLYSITVDDVAKGNVEFPFVGVNREASLNK
ncbi:MAG TPA: Rrf2 family transcriptional regulator [Nitrospinota bacterium]|nr:Rrf2 family transcriptional regulator [Nitrospinota bacterium]|tara:strand:- start:252210 stop:252674 length:465 start_codon:yes stop_codon:yes gene_type:complete